MTTLVLIFLFAVPLNSLAAAEPFAIAATVAAVASAVAIGRAALNSQP